MSSGSSRTLDIPVPDSPTLVAVGAKTGRVNLHATWCKHCGAIRNVREQVFVAQKTETASIVLVCQTCERVTT